jgi:hypothetical protein
LAIQNIQACLDSIPYEANIGIVTFNHGVTFYSIPDDLTTENIKRISCLDQEAPFCALGDEELFISVSKDREKIDFLLNHLLELGEGYSQKGSVPVQFDIVLETISQGMANGGKVLLFAGTQPTTGRSTLAATSLDDGKGDKTRYFPKVGLLDQNEYLIEKGQFFSEKRMCIDQFWFHPFGLDTATLGYLSQKTGGKMHYYNDYNPHT